MPDVRVEERRILRYGADGFSQRGNLNIANVLTIDEDTTRPWIVKAEEKTENCRLATAGGTNDGDFLTGRDGEGEVVEDGSIGMIAEANILEAQLATFDRERLCVWGVLSPCQRARSTERYGRTLTVSATD